MHVAPKGGPSSAYSARAGDPAIYAFQKSKRLRKTDEISSVFSFKCQIYGDFLRVLAKPNQLGHGRLAVVVGKKTVALAADRNYTKRLLRETFRLQQGRMTNLDIVVLVHKRFASSEANLARQEFLMLVERLQKRLS